VRAVDAVAAANENKSENSPPQRAEAKLRLGIIGGAQQREFRRSRKHVQIETNQEARYEIKQGIPSQALGEEDNQQASEENRQCQPSYETEFVAHFRFQFAAVNRGR
jgi:hypothetical protein